MEPGHRALQPRRPGRASLTFEGETQPSTLINYHRATLDVYEITGDTLDQLGDNYSSPALGLFGAALGAFLAFFIVLLTVQPLDPFKLAAFIGASIGTGGLTLIFGYFALRDYRTARSRIRAIKQRAVRA
jgi:hypothetical protein